eukprot:TRINITY_DN7144_c0_g1_i4.p1 TRINITY_DN7144_c0_g1~~TRINITY_DN7144_c0_g1_i4.p1  ORF type:complete len:587 (+),score=89.84 TRINITY_DN7144_c0_g1_i4:119-1879(+)
MEASPRLLKRPRMWEGLGEPDPVSALATQPAEQSPRLEESLRHVEEVLSSDNDGSDCVLVTPSLAPEVDRGGPIRCSRQKRAVLTIHKEQKRICGSTRRRTLSLSPVSDASTTPDSTCSRARSSASSSASSSANILNERRQRFPDIPWASNMLAQLRLQLLRAKHTGGLGSRPLQLGTDCAGAEAPWYALQAISKVLAQQLGVELTIDHRFACDVDRASRRFIVENTRPMAMFSDLLARDVIGHCLRANRPRLVPSGLDIYVAGFPCKDFSLLNSNRPCLDGPHAGIFHGVVNYIKRHQPTTYVLENVQGLLMSKSGEQAPIKTVMKLLRSLPHYEVRGWRVNSKDYYIPQHRARVYIVGIHTGRAKLRSPLREWGKLVRAMESPWQISVHGFMLDDSEMEVTSERTRCAARAQKWRLPARAGQYGLKWLATNSQLRKKLGVRPDQEPLLPKGSGWSRFMSSRQQDGLELQAVRVQKASKTHPLASDFISEVSRSVMYGSNLSQISPCLTPGSKLWVFKRERWLIGQEMLALQGFPVDEMNLHDLDNNELCLLAGNAMTVPVVGLFLYLILAHVVFPAEPGLGTSA